MILSIGDLIDKLVIENIKIFSIRDELNSGDLTAEEHTELNEAMMELNTNRGIISNELDKKLSRVISGEEKNGVLKKIKTYK
jgi:hypothetical protein